MRHDRRSAMITDEFVVEKPSFVEIKLTGDNIILYDYLLEQRFVLSPIAYEMFLEFDGIKSIRDIAIMLVNFVYLLLPAMGLNSRKRVEASYLLVNTKEA